MTGDGLYVYGVVPTTVPSTLFDEVVGIERSEPVTLIPVNDVAAIASRVPLDEFGDTELEHNLRDPAWLEPKVLAHDRVLEAAVGRATVLPFRFGTIYASGEALLDALRSRSDLAETLSRLEGAVEYGVKLFLDEAVFRARADPAGADSTASTGREYLRRKQQERRLAESAVVIGNERARETHERLAAVAADARTNPLQRPEVAEPGRLMVLNAAYLVRAEAEDRFAAELAALRDSLVDEGFVHELTGPWAPYNFASENGP